MENSQPLSIESFSYSWLVNLKPSFDNSLENSSLRASMDASDEASFIEMDPRLPPSKRFFRVSHDFNFDFPSSQSPPLSLVHADELICNGFVRPLFLRQLKMDASYGASSDTIPTTPISAHDDKSVGSGGGKLRSSSLGRYRRLSKKLLRKYLDFVRPLCRKLQGRKSGDRGENVGSGSKGERHWLYSPARTSVAYSADGWRRSCDSESSIYEAVLHCKRSIGK